VVERWCFAGYSWLFVHVPRHPSMAGQSRGYWHGCPPPGQRLAL